jgi:hypothetical protein
MTAEAFARSTPERLHGAVIIEWPQPSAVSDWPATLDSRRVTIHDAGTGAEIFTLTGVTVTAGLSGITEAEVTLYTTPDGSPITDAAERPVPDGTTGTGTFRVRVAGMRVRP